MVDDSKSVRISTLLDQPTRRYRVRVDFDDTNWVHLDREEALSYAHAVLMAASCAEYDAAIVAQMRKVLGTMSTEQMNELLALLVTDFRKRRPPIRRPMEGVTRWGHGKKVRNSPTDVMELVPGVSAFTGKAFLTVMIKGEAVGQWTVEDAREHATIMLETVSVAELDTAYLATLLDTVLDPDELPRATQIVNAIQDFRDGVH
jgi:hypothetical protein